MKRYRLIGNEFQESTGGAWVRFEDAAADVHRLNNQLTAAYLQRDALKRELAGHDGRHSLRSHSQTSVEGQS